MMRRVGFKPLAGFYKKPVAIKTTAVMLNNPNYEQEVIDKAVADLKKSKKEKELLEIVAKQPDSTEKSMILEKKYRIPNVGGDIDAYVEKTKERISNGIVYRYDCYMPQDNSIDKVLREEDFYKKLGPFKDTDLPEDEYFFYFPFSRQIEGMATIYKIDNANVYIFDDGSIDESKSVKDSLYGFLYELQESSFDKVKTKYSKLIKSLRLVNGNGQLNFSIKGLKISVKKKIIKRNFEDEFKEEQDREEKEAKEKELEELEKLEAKERELEDLITTNTTLEIPKKKYTNTEMINELLIKNEIPGVEIPKEVKLKVEEYKKIIAEKINAPSGYKFQIIKVEETYKTPLLIPLIQKIKDKTLRIVIINKSVLSLNVAALSKAVEAWNVAMLNKQKPIVSETFAKKLRELNHIINKDVNKINY